MLDKTYLSDLFQAAKGKDRFFPDTRPGILIRHDVDDDLPRSMRMAELENQHGVKATFFILNTAPYWKPRDPNFFSTLQAMQDLGHEIAWHNDALSEYLLTAEKVHNIVSRPLQELRDQGLSIRGSASHGNKMCYKFGYINYEVFQECERTREAINFKKPSFTIPKVRMQDYGLEYEAYHVPYDEYYSESGGAWKQRPDPAKLAISNNRTQILIHPQWWAV